MKFKILYQDSGSKKKASKAMESLISSLENTFSSYLRKNPHFRGVKEVTLALTLCGKVKIKSLNRTYRHKDQVTDVLSFPVYENLRPDFKVKEKNLQQIELGDLVICREKALAQSKEFGITYEQEIIHLSVHGFLHLLGYDHELSAREEEIMEKEESAMVKKIYKALKNKAK